MGIYLQGIDLQCLPANIEAGLDGAAWFVSVSVFFVWFCDGSSGEDAALRVGWSLLSTRARVPFQWALVSSAQPWMRKVS